MDRALPLFALLGSIGLRAFALADEPIPQASEAPRNPSTASPGESLNGTPIQGGIDDNPKTKQEESATKRKGGPNSAANDRAKDKVKASQSGNDATLRQLPSPAQRGGE